MDESSIVRYITDTFPDVETENAYGYTMFFYRTDHTLSFATLIAEDTEYDRYSNLNRPGVFRLNLGISKQSFQSLFGPDRVDPGSYDYTTLNTLMPHPEYAAQSFICVLNPGGTTLIQVQQLLAEAYDIAVKRFNRRNPPSSS
jgi:hypothetical protein